MRVLIVHAHPETASFNASMMRKAVSTLAEVGHEVLVSDLYAMEFDPVSDRRNFRTVADAERLDQQREEAYASANGGYVVELQAEMDKVVWCNALILQFPLWWLSMPAILKGWFDRVFALGRSYGGGRWFDRGVHAGKLALCSVTVGGPPELYSDHGFYAPLEQILFPVHRGILGFTGFTVVEPFIVYGPQRMSRAERLARLGDYRRRLLALESLPRVENPRTSDYEGFVRKPSGAGDRLG